MQPIYKYKYIWTYQQYEFFWFVSEVIFEGDINSHHGKLNITG